jgi:SAM-dependent methyltransferase
MPPVAHLSDKNYLSGQYRDATNLNARIALHIRFSTNPQGWLRWVFERLTLPPESRILEVGCGPGDLWRENADRIPPAWEITLSDLSPGMLEQARRNLAATGRIFHYEAADAQTVPFTGGEFDALIADHMLYHVPDRTKALGEFQRVLRPGGRLFASTVGRAHMREIAELVSGFDPSLEAWGSGNLASDTFTLENGGAQLAQAFTQVTLSRYEDSLVVTEPAPLVAYILSGRIQLDDARRAALAEYVKREMERGGGVFRITKETGLFEAVRGG